LNTTTTGETFRQIADFPSYAISNCGNVLNLNTNKILKPYHSGSGPYLKVKLTKDGEQFQLYIHRLVLTAFVRPPRGAEEGDHIDCNPKRNSVWNLRWLKPHENVEHRVAAELARKFINWEY
jgi:hypothetical protein